MCVQTGAVKELPDRRQAATGDDSQTKLAVQSVREVRRGGGSVGGVGRGVNGGCDRGGASGGGSRGGGRGVGRASGADGSG